MAKRSPAQRRNDARLRGKKTRRASTRKSTSKTARRRSSSKQMFPLSGEEMMIDGIASAIAGPINDIVSPFAGQIVGNKLGGFVDEASMGTTGFIMNKFGSGRVKKIGKSIFRIAWINTAGQLGSGVVRQATSGLNLGQSQATPSGSVKNQTAFPV